MRVLVYRTIPLSEETREALKSVDNVFFARRDRTPDQVMRIAREKGYHVVLNLGDSQGFLEFDDSAILWNASTVVQSLVTPGAMRRSILGHLLPPRARENFPAWVKRYGRGGRGKEYVENYTGNTFRMVAEDETVDVQEHINGTEYRVVTVGPVVVQCSRRDGANHAREYTWVGVENAPGPVASIARYASSLLPSPRTVIGWDVIQSTDRVFILEGNTCPGMNENTARRVFDMIQQFHERRVNPYERQAVAQDRAGANRWYQTATTTTTNDVQWTARTIRTPQRVRYVLTPEQVAIMRGPRERGELITFDYMITNLNGLFWEHVKTAIEERDMIVPGETDVLDIDFSSLEGGYIMTVRIVINDVTRAAIERKVRAWLLLDAIR